MAWLVVLRVVVPALVLGAVVAKLILRRPYYLERIRPRFWLRIVEKMKRRDWVKLLAIAFFFTALTWWVIYRWVTPLVAARWALYSEEEFVFTRLAEVSVPVLIVTVIILPVFEEWIFRGILLEEFARRGRSRSIGVIASALAFTAFHLTNPGTYLAYLIPGFGAGILFGICYLVSGLSGAVLTHCAYNSILALTF